MAKPKIDVIVNIINLNLLQVFCSDRDNAVREIKSIEGVISAEHLPGCIHVYVDPRYDTREVRDEIYQLLTASVPDVFKLDEE